MDCKEMKVQLPSGNLMPLIGLGTFQIRGTSLVCEVINSALKSGYRLIDTAAIYGNEADIAIALKALLPKYELKREDIFITSKLSPSDQGDAALQGLETSIRNLDCGYLDLFLIHWPGATGVSNKDPKNIELRAASWVSLMKGVERGLVRDIGVSNFTMAHLHQLLGHNFPIKPAVNQIEWHPHYQDLEMKQFCDRSGIQLQAYSSLGGSNNPRLILEPVVMGIAKKLRKSPAQVLLRWALQQNIAIIPKGKTKEHIKANIELNFTIAPEDMTALSNLSTREKYAWDPNTVE